MQTLQKICVFCGSSFGNNEIYRSEVNKLGEILASSHIELVYGGGNVGLMGEVSSSVLSHGGNVTGVIPELIYEKVEHIELTKLYIVKNMHERKAKMYELADGFIALPGGIGTLEELAEVMTWYQIGYHQKPIGILNINGFYDGLMNMMQHMVMEGFLKKEYLESVIIDSNPNELIVKMEKHKALSLDKWDN